MKNGKKYATRIQGLIAPHALIRKRHFIIVMGSPGSVQRKGLASSNINILCHNFWMVVLLFSLISFTLSVELVLCLFYSFSIDHSL